MTKSEANRKIKIKAITSDPWQFMATERLTGRTLFRGDERHSRDDVRAAAVAKLQAEDKEERRSAGY